MSIELYTVGLVAERCQSKADNPVLPCRASSSLSCHFSILDDDFLAFSKGVSNNRCHKCKYKQHKRDHPLSDVRHSSPHHLTWAAVGLLYFLDGRIVGRPLIAGHYGLSLSAGPRCAAIHFGRDACVQNNVRTFSSFCVSIYKKASCFFFKYYSFELQNKDESDFINGI